MTQEIKELRDKITHHETMAQHHTTLATSLRIQYETLVGGGTVDWGSGLLKKRPTKSHNRWVTWLKRNGPATRAAIAKDEGLLTGEVPPYADSLGLSMAELVEANYPDDMMMRISVENPQGKGRPVDVYFLWSQRFDVKPLFGVGPVQPDPSTLLGVIQPEPTEPFPAITAEWDGPLESQEVQPPEPLTAKQWVDAHSTVFSFIREGIKPTDEQRQKLRDNAPDGVDVNVAIALAAAGRLDELTG